MNSGRKGWATTKNKSVAHLDLSQVENYNNHFNFDHSTSMISQTAYA